MLNTRSYDEAVKCLETASNLLSGEIRVAGYSGLDHPVRNSDVASHEHFPTLVEHLGKLHDFIVERTNERRAAARSMLSIPLVSTSVPNAALPNSKPLGVIPASPGQRDIKGV
jgi:hypothetical protein